MNVGLSEKALEHIKKAIIKFPEIDECRIFGSRAMGNYRKGSDVDLAIYGESITPEVTLKLSVLLNEELPLPYYFDVVDATHLKHSGLMEHIEKFGQSI